MLYGVRKKKNISIRERKEGGGVRKQQQKIIKQVWDLKWNKMRNVD